MITNPIHHVWVSFFFQFATKVADEARATKRKLSAEERKFVIGEDNEGDQSSDEEDNAVDGETNHTTLPNGIGMNNVVRLRREAMKKYGKESRHNVISRKDNLVLSPDQPPRIEEDNEDDIVQTKLPDKGDLAKMSAATFQSQFHLDSVLDYVKTGIGSIIEDEVTGRFVAEELKVT